MMRRQVRQMTRLINDLMDVSRITRRKVQLHREPVVCGQAIFRRSKLRGAIETSSRRSLCTRPRPVGRR